MSSEPNESEREVEAKLRALNAAMRTVNGAVNHFTETLFAVAHSETVSFQEVVDRVKRRRSS